jgi:hypothetical protein
MSESPEISGLLYKKRGGFGKMTFNPWQFRFFTIINGVLSYYDTDTPDIAFTETKARGRLDLRAKKVSSKYCRRSIEAETNQWIVMVCRWKCIPTPH